MSRVQNQRTYNTLVTIKINFL